MEQKPFNQGFFNKIANQFDNHVRQSIPLFDEYIKFIVPSIVNLVPNHSIHSSILDICGSTGLMGSLLRENGYNGLYYNLDGSPEMAAISRKRFEDAGDSLSFTLMEGFMNSWVDMDEEIRLFSAPKKSFDLIIEHLGFQFFSKNRWNDIKEVASLLKDDGVFVTFEKVHAYSPKKYLQQEHLKDFLHKSKSFSIDEINDKKENVLVEMGEHQCGHNEFYEILTSNFKTVKKVAHIGNFVGYICGKQTLLIDTDDNLLDNIFTV